MAVINNLYPPIVDTYMPAFLIGSSNEEQNKCRIYFSLSLYNNSDQIQNIQVVLRNQATNLNALNPSKYPSGVMLTTLNDDITRKTDDHYYIDLLPEDIINEEFIVDQYYKVQIRFTDTSATAISLDIPQAIDN